jgi:hypothetical protein
VKFFFFKSIILTPFLFLLLSTVFAKSIAAQTILFEDNFENGLEKWEAVRGSIDDWVVQDGMVGTLIQSSGVKREIVPKDQWWDENWGNYVFEFDVIAKSGVDKNFPFRFQALDRWYEIHHTQDSQGWYRFYLSKVYPGEGGNLTSAKYSEEPGVNKYMLLDTLYHIRITVNSDQITFCLTENQGEEKCVIDYKNTGTSLKTGKISLKATTGASYPTEVWFDNIVVTEISTSSGNLNVPDVKQYSPPWNDDVYDQATSWSANPTIERWGCALTVADMVLQYHGHNINPDSLNNWLISQPDGYVRNGLLNWLAVSRYSLVNAGGNAKALEFRRYVADDSTLSSEIDNSRPAIVKIPGHFVVTKGKQDSDFLINDPASSTNSLLSEVETQRGKSYSQIYSYRPTNTDLSYLMVVVDADHDLKVFGPDNSEIQGYTFIEEPLVDDIDGTSQSGQALKIFQYPTPANGQYRLEVTGSETSYTLDAYLYDTSGNLIDGAPTTLNNLTARDINLNYDTNPTTPTVEIPDQTPPTISAQITPTPNSAGWNNADTTITWTVTDNESDIISSTGCETTTISEETAGTTLTCSATSSGGINSESVTIKLDKTPPSVPILSSPANGSYLTTLSPNLTWASATDTLSGLKTSDTYRYQVDNDSTFPYPRDRDDYTTATNPKYTPTLSEGTYYWRIAARDAAGNSSDFSQTWSFTLDITPPGVPGTPTTTSPTNSLSQTWTWQAAQDPISGILQYIWRVIENELGGTTTQSSVTTNLNEGTWNFSIKAQDYAGNEGSESSGQVLVDTTPPTASWINPKANSTVSGQVMLEVLAQDNPSGVKEIKFQYKRNDDVDGFHDTGTIWDTTDLSLDEYTLRAIVTDNAGNTANFDQNINVTAVISNQSSTTPSSSEAIISWTTDRPTSSRVIYDTTSHPLLGEAPNYDYAFSSSTYDLSPKVLAHSVTLTGLAAGTTYYYRIVSEGSPAAVSEEKTFKTLTIAGPPASTVNNLSPSVLAEETTPESPAPTTQVAYEQEEKNQEPGGTKEKDVLAKTTEREKEFFFENIHLFIILFLSLSGLIYLQIKRFFRKRKRGKQP